MAPSIAEGLALLRAARLRGVKHGVVEDKIFLPGLQKLSGLATQGFFGRITGFRLDLAGGYSTAPNARVSDRVGIINAAAAVA